jgi:hypothetical protein
VLDFEPGQPPHERDLSLRLLLVVAVVVDDPVDDRGEDADAALAAIDLPAQRLPVR